MFNRTVCVFSLVIAMSVGLLSCNKKDKESAVPKERIKAYVEKSFSIKRIEDREELEEFLIGDAKTRLAAWSDQQFEDAFIGKKRKFSRLFFREVKPIHDEEVNITYELTFLDRSEVTQKSDVRITNKKSCQMVKRNAEWYIKSCKNIKQLVEYNHELSLP